MNHLAKLLTKLRKTKRNCSSKGLSRNRFGSRLRLERLEERALLAGFNFADFSDIDGLQLVGSATINADHELRLTPVSPTIPGVPIHNMRGGAWYIADKSPVAAGFNTTFQFRASNLDESRTTWGFAFVIQNSNPFEIRDGGSGLGYAGQMPDGIPNSLAIEFDNTQDPNLNDPSSSHVSVHTNGTGPNSAHEDYSIGSASMSGFTLDDGRVHTARIDYTPGTLRVFLDDLTAPLLIVPLELGTKLDTDAGRAWLGFTSGNSDLMEIINWDAQLVGDFVIADHPSVIEGAAATTTDLSFAVKRIGNLSGQIIVNWATVDGTAIGSSDFTADSGQLIFAPGESQKTVVVTVAGDSQLESHESFGIVLSSDDPALRAIAGKATVLNDDAEVSISDSSAIEASQQTANLGAFVNRGDNGSMTFSTGLAWGPDGHLYAASSLTHEILKFDGTTGAFLGNFVSAGMGIEYPAVEGLVWHGNILYVLCRDSAKVLKFSASGTSLGLFVSPGSGGLQFAKGMVRGPDGTWYISSANAVLRYSAEGTPLGSLSVPNGTLNTPRGLRFGPDGHLYVASENNDSVIRFLSSGSNVIFDRVFIAPGSGGLKKPGSLVFHNGSLLVSSRDSNEVLRFNGITGAFEGAAVSAGQGGLLQPHGLLLDAQGNLLVGVREEILRFGPASQAAFSVNLSSPSALPISFEYATSTGSGGSSDYVATSGTITFAPGQTSRTIVVQTLDDATYEGNETFMVNLSNASGAVIADAQGTATIIDNELPPTKFYVVNDGSPDRTYEYTASGAAIENYAMQSTNTAPRGAASTAAGDKVWVVDANKKVYVYDTSGGLLGSWSLGSLASNATVEGITTNGTDVWIVDSRSDKVFKYAGAATRTSGSQNASSSFSLNRSNTSPTDLVTDGASIWVLNNTSSTDKVFKYSVGGSLLGSWTITSGGGSPTGLTIDPTMINSNIWIVDNNTDRVYQFDSASTRTSGSASPSSSFALAAGNTNPQGIADPPTPASMLASQGPRVASGTSMPEVEKPNRKTLTSSDPFIAQVDSIFENWNEDSVFSHTKKRLAGRR